MQFFFPYLLPFSRHIRAMYFSSSMHTLEKFFLFRAVLFHFRDLGVIFSLLSFPPHSFLRDQQSQSSPAAAEPPLGEGSRVACPNSFLIFCRSDILPLSRYIGVFFVKSSAFLAGLYRGFVVQLVRFSLCSGMSSVQLCWPNSWTFHYINALYLCPLLYSFYFFFYSVQLLLKI